MPATASTPGSGCLPSLARLAKSKIQTRSQTALGREIGPKMARKFLCPVPSHPGPPRSSWPQEVPMRRLIAAILAIPTLFNGLAMLARRSPLVRNRPRGIRNRPLQPAFRPGHRRGIPRGRPRARRAGMAAAILAGGRCGRRLPGRARPDPSGDDRRRPQTITPRSTSSPIVLPSAAALYSAFPNQGENHA